MPKNYDQQFHGPVSARTALASSYNIPAVKVLQHIGLPRTIELARKLGIAPETALRRACDKFQDRFESMEHGILNEGQTIDALSLDELDRRWNLAKAATKGRT
ncbi:MAG TPA: hypothetical protein PLH72_13490 [Vicinamibacterales bacterium]|nr:hypothetical protein [Vicinamibacterales bacterium]